MLQAEKLVQCRIQGALKAWGYLSVHIPNRGLWNPRQRRYNFVNDPYFVKGIPDLVVLLPEARVLWIEVKAEDGRRSPAQERVAAELVERGHSYLLARSVKEVMWWLRDHNYRFGECA